MSNEQTKILRKIRTEVKRLKERAENSSSGIPYDDEDISYRCGETWAYYKVLQILERYINEQ